MLELSERLILLLVISYIGLMVVELMLLGIKWSLVGDMTRYLYIMERVSAIWLSCPTVCSMVQLKVIRKSCYLASFCLPGVHCMKLSRGLNLSGLPTGVP